MLSEVKKLHSQSMKGDKSQQRQNLHPPQKKRKRNFRTKTHNFWNDKICCIGLRVEWREEKSVNFKIEQKKSFNLKKIRLLHQVKEASHKKPHMYSFIYMNTE